MSLVQILAFLKSFGPALEPLLLDLEQNQLQPAIQKAIGEVSSPDVKALLMALDAGLDQFAQVEIKKLG